MYLHIGKNVMVHQNQIIGIFDLKVLKEKEQAFYTKLKEEHKMIDVCQNNPKTFILIQKKDGIIGYISNISSMTLGKRTK